MAGRGSDSLKVIVRVRLRFYTVMTLFKGW